MATVYPFPRALYHPFMLWRQFILNFPRALYHPFMLWRQFILSLWIFIIHSYYGDSFFFPYGSLSSFHVMAAVYPFPMALYHPFILRRKFPMALYHTFMLWRQLILSLIIHSCNRDSLSFHGPLSYLMSLHHSFIFFIIPYVFSHYSMYLSFHNVSLPFLTILVSFSSFLSFSFYHSFTACIFSFPYVSFRYFSSSFPMSIFQYIMSFSMPPL